MELILAYKLNDQWELAGTSQVSKENRKDSYPFIFYSEAKGFVELVESGMNTDMAYIESMGSK